LATWEGMEIDDGVDTLCRTRVHNTINQLETAVQDLIGLKIVHQVSMACYSQPLITTIWFDAELT